MSPKRIQLRRTKGWRLPENAKSCARPGKYGNPFKLRDEGRGLVCYGPEHLERFGREWDYEGRISANDNRHDMWFSRDDVVETYVRWATRAEVVELHRLTLTDPTPGMLAAWPSNGGRFCPVTIEDIQRDLRDFDLGCHCALCDEHLDGLPLGVACTDCAPCHVDTLLELANPKELLP